MPEVISTHLTTPDERFYLDAWHRAIESSGAKVDAILGRVITLASAMSAGSFIFLSHSTEWARIGASFTFLVALLVGLYGSIPSGYLLPFDHEAIKAALIRSARVKKWWLYASLFLTVAGFGVAIAGAIFHGLK